MTLSFRYKKVRRQNKEIKSPLIPISFSGKINKYPIICLLDSGADASLIPKDFAELLGLDLNGEKGEIRGLDIKLPVVEKNVTIEIGRPHETHSFQIPVKVLLENSEQNMPPIIGRSVFFDKFAITFDQLNDKILLKHNSQQTINKKY